MGEGRSDLHSSSINFLERLGYNAATPFATSSSLDAIASAALHVVYQYAFTHDVRPPPDFLDALSILASVEGLCNLVFEYYGPLILDLLARWVRPCSPVQLSIAASLASVRPDLWSLIESFVESQPFSDFLDPEAPSETLHTRLLTQLRLLIADPHLASRHDWPNAPLYALRSHPDNGVRLLAVQVLSLQLGWSEMKRMRVEQEWIGEVDKVDAEILYGEEVDKLDQSFTLRKVYVDGWVLPVVEAKRTIHCDISNANVTHLDLSPRTALLADTLLLRSSPAKADPTHVDTSAVQQALSDLVSPLQLGRPILISSPSSSGKSHLIHHLCSQLHPEASRILTIPLADTSIDVKSLIGTYVSSPTKPGTFEWMEGALTKAMRAGRWVVFDDIDRASVEMLVTITGISRSLRLGRPGRRARLTIPGRGDVEAGSGFALFATRSNLDSSFMGQQEFVQVVLQAPTDDDILAILTARFHLPLSLMQPLIYIWQQLRPLAKTSGQVKARNIGLRDLEKWCARIQIRLHPGLNNTEPFANPVFQDEIMLEAADLFVASLDTKPGSLDKRIKMIAVIADGIGMDEERALSLLDLRKPQIEHVASARQLRIGRTAVETNPAVKNTAPSRPFALTKPSRILLERIAAAIATGEPTLLVGETGTGKTTAVQYIADTCRKPLTVLNLSMQTESSDLLGGFKPIDASVTARLLHTRWQKLFTDTFSMAKPQNGAYIEATAKALSGRRWGRCSELWAASSRRAVEKLRPTEGHEAKKRKLVSTKMAKLAVQWQSLLVEIADFDLHHVKMKSKLVFSFIEGPLVKAIQHGEWILLDEVNLASQETLEAISTILEGSSSLVLTERGDVEPIPRHPDFRLFACMNPATDVGKKDLPPNLRDRFTELYVPPPDDDRDALITIVSQYINDAAAGDRGVILDVVEMYSTLKRLSAAKEIVDGSNAAPHYSMRTLARALTFAIETVPTFGLRRGLWEGCLMAFTMSLDMASAKRAHDVCEQYILNPMKNARAVLSQIPPEPSSDSQHIRFGPFWLRRGPLPPVVEDRYVITPSVQAKLSDLARVILTHRYPVLIQGPTSAGKTSAVEFLAKQTGHRFVRINNHEHTDIQEYLGTYVTNPETGNLIFQEGLLVTAVRHGHWIVLDELNLAPTDVLEALNRLLDDNRELVIPETQEVIKPHPNFILFATQNPPGLYAGRKVLSRAFRNRFLEVHFDDVPKSELETILCQRCQIAPSYAKRIVQVFEELRHRRQASRVFESKQSFATLRDLFRWAERGAVGYQQLANDGYMLLAERGRQAEDKAVIKEVLETVMKVTVDESLYQIVDTPTESVMARLPFKVVPDSSMVWTRAMQRLFSLVAFALTHNEPVLLVGETGCGKTSVCEVIARAFNQQLIGVNCHQNMETADLLGSQRPVRNRHERKAKVIATLSQYTEISSAASEDEALDLCVQLLSTEPNVTVQACHDELKALTALFEWSDGPLVHAMHSGDLLLLDEVSLADDSVLERLNSVLEPGRTLVLAEKGGVDIDEATLVAHPSFHVVATMNPGGDFGKKELSPALRNRFTEIWVPPLDDRRDLLTIIHLSWKHEALIVCGEPILDFFSWFKVQVGDGGLGLRDILAWVDFSNQLYGKGVLDVAGSFFHGGQMVLIDGLESLQIASSVVQLRQDCLSRLAAAASSLGGAPPPLDLRFTVASDVVSIGGFGLKLGHLRQETSFRFDAPTTASNAMRVLRGCQLPKAILLEGSPGVGKTSLVAALAAVSGHHLQRINLSDQTDLIDLFGSDLPVEGGAAGEFQWRDAAFLDAMQKGDWVLLDEMNLASQTVLEGLNAVLDHRGTVYIPELGRSFDRHPDFRIFAAQNPLQQGGGRKGLPKSFLNRFTKVYLQEHTPEDLMIICRQLNPMPEDTVEKMITFNEVIREATMVSRMIGREGSPWEFNLRDLFRWFSLLGSRDAQPVDFLRLVYTQRFRNQADREAVQTAFESIFSCPTNFPRPAPSITPDTFQIGHASIERSTRTVIDTTIKHDHLDVAESVLSCVGMGWLVILAGESGSGKSSLVRAIADGAGRELGEFSMHPGVDTSEILGSFEQRDQRRSVEVAYAAIRAHLNISLESDVKAEAELNALHAAYLDSADSSKFVATCRAILSAYPATSLDNLVDAVERSADSTGFAWVDGQLIHALRNGGWFLISSANLCSPAVLDRLNSLCETNGVLVLSEKGSAAGTPEVIKPHPDFRLFMTYDPKHGELSRAMRNRGVELYLEKVAAPPPKLPAPLADHSTLSSLVTIQGSEPEQTSPPSAVSNVLATSTPFAFDLLGRFGRLTPDAELYQSARDFLAGTNHPISSETAVFRILQLVLRNLAQQNAFLEWTSDPANAKSILTMSAHAGRGRVRKAMAGKEVWAYTAGLRDMMPSVATSTFGLDANPTTVEQLERLMVLVHLIEQRAQGQVFDYSSTQLLAVWSRAIVEDVPALQAVLPHLEELAQSLTLTRGLGQAQIWTLFRDGANSSLQSLGEEILVKLVAIRDIPLRVDIVQALVQSDFAPHHELVDLLDSFPVSNQSGSQPIQVSTPSRRWSNRDALAGVELNVLLSEEDRNGGVRLLVHDPLARLPDVARLQAAFSSPAQPATTFRAIAAWLAGLWRDIDFDHEDQPDHGPSSLFQPSRLASSLRYSSSEATSLADIPQENEALRCSTELVVWSTRNPVDTRSQSLQLALHVISMLASAFGFNIENPDDLRRVMAADGVFPDRLKCRLDGYALQSEPLALSSLAQLWITISQLLLDLFVTNIPIDPAVRRVLLGDVITSRLSLLEEGLAVVEAGERAVKGIADSARVLDIRNRISTVLDEQNDLGPAIDRSTDAGQLAVLFNEIHSYLGESLDDAKISGLVNAIGSGHPQAIERERGFQLSSSAVLNRLTSNYPDLQDLVQPVTTAILFAKFGMRLLVRHARPSVPLPSIELAVRFPLADALPQLQALCAADTSTIQDQFLAATAMSVAMQSPEQRLAVLPRFVEALTQLYTTWSDVRQREQEDEQAAESLYRVRKTDIEVLSDLEQEEKEFAELFPTYDEGDDQPAPKEPEVKTKFGADDVKTFRELLIGTSAQGKTILTPLRTKIDQLLATDFSASQYDETMDNSSRAVQIRYVHRRLSEMKQRTDHPNFYLSANEPEIRKAYDLVTRLMKRLDKLIEDWPEQVVPQHIRDRCERILALSTRSPVAQVLSSLEQLLVHTNDWEGYANKENSLVSYQNELSALIVEWRRLELASWMRLLDDQVEQYVATDDEWSLRLYGACIQGVLIAEDVDDHLRSILPMISTFLSSSSLGHFIPRVSTLRILGSLAKEISQSHANADRLLKSAKLLYNVVANAMLYHNRVADSLHQQRAVIDKSIKDFVKLASWKDVNVYALKASAVKSHRQLHRNIRKFRDVLRQPVGPILADFGSICPTEAPVAAADLRDGSIFSLVQLSEDASQPRHSAVQHLARLPDTLRRYSTVHEQARAAISTAAARQLDGMAVDIIETVAELAKATPAKLTKENTKIVNNLASRKRKAYADLLKALRASGFSQNVRADQLAKQQSDVSLAGLSPLDHTALPQGFNSHDAAAIEKYHHRQAVLMNGLRAAFNGHNPDIASQDLQRGIGYAESLYATALVEREHLVSDLLALQKLHRLSERLRHCSQGSQLVGGAKVANCLRQAEINLLRIRDGLLEVREGATQLRGIQNLPVKPDDLEAVHQSEEQLTSLLSSISGVTATARSSQCLLFTRDESSLLQEAKNFANTLSSRLRVQASKTDDLAYMLLPVASMIDNMAFDTIPAESATLISELWQQGDDLIQALLVVAQDLKSDPPIPTDDEYMNTVNDMRSQRTNTRSLRINEVLERTSLFISTLATQASTQVSTDAPQALVRILPFLNGLGETFARHVASRTYAIKSQYKLAYVVARLLLDIAQKGFCKPQEESDSKDGEDSEAVDGTGMGAGTGDKNVSSEIEEEGQVEGLQGEKEEEEDQEDKEGEDDAVSMDEDFEGALGDAKPGEEDEEGSGDEEERDDHVGDVDPLDSGAVDEKFWGDEEKEDKGQEEREDLMNEKTQESGDSELAAKESEGKDKKDEGKKDQTEGEQDTQQDDTEHGETQDDFDEIDNEQEGDEGDEGAAPTQDDVAAPEGDRLDLPEDLDLGEEEEVEGEAGETFDDVSMEGGEEDGDEKSDGGVASDDDGDVEEDAPPATGATEEEAMEQDDTLNPNVDMSAANEAQAPQSAEAGSGLEGGMDMEAKQEQQPQDPTDSSAQKQPEGEGSAPQDQNGASNNEQPEGDGPVGSSGAPMPADSAGPPQSARSLGDIMEDIRRRRDEILAQQDREEASSDPKEAEQAPGQVEYLHEGDADEGMQALGAAGEEERQKLEDLNIVDDDDMEGETVPQGMDETVDEDVRQMPPRPAEATIKTEQGDPTSTEKALTHSEVRGNAPAPVAGDEMELDDLEEPAQEMKPENEEDAEVELKHADEIAKTSANNGEDLWRQYAALTSDLSYALCEQLRLILEPTMATRLQGDFRTGKRLNMRKIIPYIASEYTKDKIWLRRTKPSRREYQVLLSLDDSRSMAESHSVHLAYQTLALVSQALNKLEVGQISIARFGESVDILHPFGDTGFTEADGAKVMNSFQFDQHRTDVAALVDRSLSFLAEARQRQASSSSAPDLWQLQVIISDGVCQDHHRLRTLLRRALEERVMIVFIIVDSLHQNATTATQTSTQTSTPTPSATARTSILSMQTVAYTQVNGEMQLEMQRYLDTFPFEFYVVLRDVEALPGVLADTLRQWMARVSQSQE